MFASNKITNQKLKPKEILKVPLEVLYWHLSNTNSVVFAFSEVQEKLYDLLRSDEGVSLYEEIPDLLKSKMIKDPIRKELCRVYRILMEC